MLTQGRTAGVFQMESTGMTGVCMGLKPQSIEDLFHYRRSLPPRPDGVDPASDRLQAGPIACQIQASHAETYPFRHLRLHSSIRSRSLRFSGSLPDIRLARRTWCAAP